VRMSTEWYGVLFHLLSFFGSVPACSCLLLSLTPVYGSTAKAGTIASSFVATAAGRVGITCLAAYSELAYNLLAAYHLSFLLTSVSCFL